MVSVTDMFSAKLKTVLVLIWTINYCQMFHFSSHDFERFYIQVSTRISINRNAIPKYVIIVIRDLEVQFSIKIITNSRIKSLQTL